MARTCNSPPVRIDFLRITAFLFYIISPLYSVLYSQDSLNIRLIGQTDFNQDLSHLSLGNSPQSIEISGDIVFMADGPRGIQIADVSDQLNPIIIDTYQTGEVVYDI